MALKEFRRILCGGGEPPRTRSRGLLTGRQGRVHLGPLQQKTGGDIPGPDGGCRLRPLPPRRRGRCPDGGPGIERVPLFPVVAEDHPQGTGQVNEKGLDFYSRLVDKLLEKNIIPISPCSTGTLPQALEDRGSWRNRDCAKYFADYAAVVADRLSDRVGHWITLNEPTIFVEHGYEKGVMAPGAKETGKLYKTIVHNVLVAHGLGMQAIRSSAKQKPEAAWRSRSGRRCPTEIMPMTGKRRLRRSVKTGTGGCSRCSGEPTLMPNGRNSGRRYPISPPMT